jgi:hypothetical protein
MYLWNLEQRLAKAKADGRGLAPAAREADEFLKTMRERISVDPREYFAEQMDAKEAGSGVTVGWTAKRFDRYRWLVARMIMGLDETLAK